MHIGWRRKNIYPSEDIQISKEYLNIGFRNEKDIMLSERYDWASIKDNKKDGNDQTLFLNHSHLYNVFCVVRLFQLRVQ